MSANVHHLEITRAGTRRATAAEAGGARSKSLIVALRRLWEHLLLARERRAAINDLSALDDRQLEDIGVRREEIPQLVQRSLRR